MSQCVLYDGTGPDAKLIGIEYLVSDALYRKMPPEEKLYWHDHKYEVDSGLLKSLTQTGEDEKKTLAVVKTALGQGVPHLGDRQDLPQRPAPAVLGRHRRGAVRPLAGCETPGRDGGEACEEVSFERPG